VAVDLGLDVERLKVEVKQTYAIEHGPPVDSFERSKFEDTRAKAQKFGARGTTVKAYKPRGR
jgi:hypothetical protein